MGEVIEISTQKTSPWDVTDLCSPASYEDAQLRPKKGKATSAPMIEGHVTHLRLKEVKSVFMGNYANLCPETGVKKPFAEKQLPNYLF